jgi:hypothetical protein
VFLILKIWTAGIKSIPCDETKFFIFRFRMIWFAFPRLLCFVVSLSHCTSQENEYQTVRNKIQEAQKEMILVNDAKLRARQDKTNIKNQMIADMEEFSKELQVAKQSISSTQDVIIGTIRDKMESSFATWEQGQSTNNHLFSPGFLSDHTSSALSRVKTNRSLNSNSIHKHDSRISFDSGASAQDNDIGYLLHATGAVSMEALISDLHQSEEYIFRYSSLPCWSLIPLSLYKNIQNSSVELEKIELENKQLESQVDEKVSFLPTSLTLLFSSLSVCLTLSVRRKTWSKLRVTIALSERISSSTSTKSRNPLLSTRTLTTRTCRF